MMDEERVFVRGERRRAGVTQVVTGLALVAVGLGITIVTYGGAAESGGTYVVAWGPVVFGLVRFVRGLGTLAG